MKSRWRSVRSIDLDRFARMGAEAEAAAHADDVVEDIDEALVEADDSDVAGVPPAISAAEMAVAVIEALERIEAVQTDPAASAALIRELPLSIDLRTELITAMRDLNRRIVGVDGRLARVVMAGGVKREVFLEAYLGKEGEAGLAGEPGREGRGLGEAGRAQGRGSRRAVRRTGRDHPDHRPADR